MGGNTIGSATTAPIGTRHPERVRASHHANGMPSASRIKVVSPASFSVTHVAAIHGVEFQAEVATEASMPRRQS
ncbi:hypothetical protein GCM10028795_15370 [Lysobacter olei]